MNKKIFASIVIVLCAIFSFTICFATDNTSGLKEATNDVRNFVGGVENTVEDAAKDVSNTSRDVTGDIENGLDNDTRKNSNNNRTASGSIDNNGGYTATRTSAGNNFMGMTSTAWTWLIVGIAAIAIIAVVWYYSMQFTNNNRGNDE